MSAGCDAETALRIAGKQKRLVAFAAPEEVRHWIARYGTRQFGDSIQRGGYVAGYNLKGGRTWLTQKIRNRF